MVWWCKSFSAFAATQKYGLYITWISNGFWSLARGSRSSILMSRQGMRLSVTLVESAVFIFHSYADSSEEWAVYYEVLRRLSRLNTSPTNGKQQSIWLYQAILLEHSNERLRSLSIARILWNVYTNIHYCAVQRTRLWVRTVPTMNRIQCAICIIYRTPSRWLPSCCKSG